MEIKIRVEIGVTPELAALAAGLAGSMPALGAAGTRKEAAVATFAPQAVEQAAPEAEKATAAKRKAKAGAQDEPSGIVKEPQAEPATDEEPKAEAKAAYTEEDVREAMHQCRLRIEGADYKVNSESDGYRKHHRALTAQFKLMAQELGSDRPSTLPEELRGAFIKDCEDLCYEEGEYRVKVPF